MYRAEPRVRQVCAWTGHGQRVRPVPLHLVLKFSCRTSPMLAVEELLLHCQDSSVLHLAPCPILPAFQALLMRLCISRMRQQARTDELPCRQCPKGCMLLTLSCRSPNSIHSMAWL